MKNSRQETRVIYKLHFSYSDFVLKLDFADYGLDPFTFTLNLYLNWNANYNHVHIRLTGVVYAIASVIKEDSNEDNIINAYKLC